MQNKWLFALGYKCVTFGDNHLKTALALLKKEKISAHATATAEVHIPLYLWKRAKKALQGKVVFNEQGIGGVARIAPMLFMHLGGVTALACFLLFYLFASRFVFDVRIEGNELYTSEALLEEIEKSGLHAGVLWDHVDFSAVENRILSLSDQIAWVNINRRGLVAYVSLREREGARLEAEKKGYANIVSRFDGVVEDITVVDGAAVVQIGSTVKRGDLLISAFDESGTPTHASGSVSARVWGEISVFIPREEEISVQKEYRTAKKSIKIFDFLVNIFKNYRNLPSECDIRRDERQILLAKGKALPIKVLTEYAVIDQKQTITRTDEELISLARRAHESALLAYLSDAELVFVKTSASFSEGGYTVRSQVCMLKEIGESVPLTP